MEIDKLIFKVRYTVLRPAKRILVCRTTAPPFVVKMVLSPINESGAVCGAPTTRYRTADTAWMNKEALQRYLAARGTPRLKQTSKQ